MKKTLTMLMAIVVLLSARSVAAPIPVEWNGNFGGISLPDTRPGRCDAWRQLLGGVDFRDALERCGFGELGRLPPGAALDFDAEGLSRVAASVSALTLAPSAVLVSELSTLTLLSSGLIGVFLWRRYSVL